MNINGFNAQPLDGFMRRPASAEAERPAERSSEPSTQRQQAVVPSAESSRQRAQRWQQLNTFYDQPPQGSRRALEAYQGVQMNERREQVESMFGVDIYA